MTVFHRQLAANRLSNLRISHQFAGRLLADQVR